MSRRFCQGPGAITASATLAILRSLSTIRKLSTLSVKDVEEG